MMNNKKDVTSWAKAENRQEHYLAPKNESQKSSKTYICSVEMVPQEVVLFLTLEVVLLLTLERLQLVLKLTLQAHICAYIYIYI